MKKRINIARTVIFAVFVLIIILWAVPLVWAVLTSFKQEAEIRAGGFTFLPQVWSLENYERLLGNPDRAPVVKWFLNSLIISGGGVISSLCIVSMAAYGYSRLEFKGRDRLFLTLMALSMLPSIAGTIPLYKIISMFGWVNHKVAVIVPGLGGMGNVFLMRQFMLGIPKDFDESAKIDGATSWQIFLRIIVPMSKPILAVVALFSFTGSWNDFLWPSIVFNDVEAMPLTAGLQLLLGSYGTFEIGVVLAGTCLALIPTLVLYLFAGKYFMMSLSLNAGIKG